VEKKSESEDSNLISYAASNKFTSNGVTEGSIVFIVTVIEGELFLGGFIKVFKILNKSSAAKYLAVDEHKLWEADEYIVAEKGKEELFLNDNKIPSSISHKLEFIKGTGFVNPVIRAGKIDE
jgi:hypothetical protein